MQKIMQQWRQRRRVGALWAAVLFAAVGIAQLPVTKVSAEAGAKWPTSGQVTSRYGDPRGGGRTHKGIDISTPGNVPIYAAQDGTVYHRQETPSADSGYGYYVIMAHSNGYKSLYAHLQGFATSDGQFVRQGDVIGYMGESGAGGHHVHFEVRSNASYGSALDGDTINFNSAIPPNGVVSKDSMVAYAFPNLVSTTPQTQVANVNSCGALYIKRTYWGNWDQHMGCGQAKSVAMSPDGNLIAIIRPDNTLVAKESYWGNWVQHTAVGDSQKVAVGANGTIASINGCGALYVKRSWWGNWDQHMGCGQAKDVSISGDGETILVTRPDNTMVGKGSYWGNWIEHTAIGDSQDSAVGSNGYIANVNGCGALYVKKSYWGNWEEHMGCGQAKKVAISPNGEGIVVVRPDNTLIAKQSYWGNWEQHVGVGDTQDGAVANP